MQINRHANNKRQAFTLAEVLITLGIIGVVAALTIPTLMNSNAKSEQIAQLKKAYATFNSALLSLTQEMGCTSDIKCTGLFSASAAQTDFGEELVKYLKVIKNCKTTDSGCFSKALNRYYDGSGANLDYDSTTFYRFITADGASYYLYSYADNCASNWSSNFTGNMKQVCGYVLIDINGPIKRPNYWGKDIFWFFITNGHGATLYPFGGKDYVSNWWGDTGTPRCNSTDTLGSYCAGRVLEEGWQMNY